MIKTSQNSRRSRAVILLVTVLLLASLSLALRHYAALDHVSSHPAPPQNAAAFPDDTLLNLPVQPIMTETAKRNATVGRLYRIGHMNWLDYLDTLDDAGLAPLTKMAQRWIYEKQHPPKELCGEKKFLVSTGTQEIGLGAYLHKQGFGLGAALEGNLIYVLDHVGTHEGKYEFADNCGTETKKITSLDCFTQPLSSCSVEDAVYGKNAWKFDEHEWERTNIENQMYHKDWAPTYLKKKLQEYFAGAELSPAFYKIWWRGQSAAYLSRLNAETSDLLLQARNDKSIHRTWLHANDERPLAGVPFPMPPGTMNLHVRHGDKATEMTLMPFKNYVDSAEMFSSQNPQMYMRRLFVSSEDPTVIEDAQRLPQQQSNVITSPDAHWQVFTSNIPRVNSGPYQQIRKYGASNMTRSWYLQLWMALECDVFFGTRASNWNRIIDEFRCIFVDKCQLPYFEMGPQNDWKDYFW
ncbi:hypothetical protein DFJ77DRAFT_513089 [Powellomyces hirtus]|nr:hypothetical protein DFJ77DRAFT_513089 [Powellomyces hirtus]